MKLLYSRTFRDSAKIVLLICWAGLIYYLSSVPDLFAGAQIWEELIIRKIAHAVVFGFFAFLIYKTISLSRNKFEQTIMISALLSIFYAISDELHQAMVPGRHASAIDILIDSFGILIAIWLIKLEHEHQLRYPERVHFVRM